MSNTQDIIATGYDAIALAEEHADAITLHAYADPTQGERHDIAIDAAIAVATEDSSLIYATLASHLTDADDYRVEHNAYTGRWLVAYHDGNQWMTDVEDFATLGEALAEWVDGVGDRREEAADRAHRAAKDAELADLEAQHLARLEELGLEA